ncbi:MAG: polyketide cyclase / dehydrase and lipid transport [Pseudonocardiales bacterium]
MPQVDLISANFVVADPATVAAAVHDEGLWADLWPRLDLTVGQDRGVKGIRWTCSGPLVGSCEVWLEAYGDGVIVHCYLRAERVSRREGRRRQRQVNRVLFALKDSLEGGRPAGTGRSSAGDDLPIPQR